MAGGMQNSKLGRLPKIGMNPLGQLANRGQDVGAVALEGHAAKGNGAEPEDQHIEKENGKLNTKLVLPSDNQENLLEKISELRESLDALRLETRGKREEAESLKAHISECHSKDVLQCRRIAELEDDLSLTKACSQTELETLRGVALATLNDSIADYTAALADVRGELAATKISLKEAGNSNSQLKEAHRLERERLVLEASELRLLYQSRGRQISELQDEVQNVREKEAQSVTSYREQIEQVSKDARFWKEKFFNLERQVYERGDEVSRIKEAKDKAEREYGYATEARAKAEAREKELSVHNEMLKGRLDDLESQLGVERDMPFTSDCEQLRSDFEEEKARLQHRLEEEISRREEAERALQRKSHSVPSLELEHSSDGQSLTTPAQTEIRLRFHDSDWSASSSDSSRNELGTTIKDNAEMAKRDWEAALGCQDSEDNFDNETESLSTAKNLNLDVLRESTHAREMLESTKDQLSHVQSLNKKLVIRCQELEKDCSRERNYLQAERKKLYATLESQIKKDSRRALDQEIAEMKACLSREKKEMQEDIQKLESANENLLDELERVKREYAECKLEYEIESVTIGLEKQQDATRQKEELERELQGLREREMQLVEQEEKLQARAKDQQLGLEFEQLQIQERRQRIEKGQMENAEHAARLSGHVRNTRELCQSLADRESALKRHESSLTKREQEIMQKEEFLRSEHSKLSELNEKYHQRLEEVSLRVEQNEKLKLDIDNAKGSLAQRETSIASQIAWHEEAWQSARKSVEIGKMRLEDERCASILQTRAIILDCWKAREDAACLKSKLGSWVKECNSQRDDIRTYKQEIAELKNLVETGRQDQALINELEEGLKASQRRERELERQLKAASGKADEQLVSAQRYDASSNSRRVLGSEASPPRGDNAEHESLGLESGASQAQRHLQQSSPSVQSLNKEIAANPRHVEDSPYTLRRSWPQSPQLQRSGHEKSKYYNCLQQSPVQTFTFSRVQQHSPNSDSLGKQKISNVVNHMEDDVCRLTLTSCSEQRSFHSPPATGRSLSRLSTEAQRHDSTKASMLALSLSSEARSSPSSSRIGLNRSFDNHLLRQVSLLEFTDAPPERHEESDFLALRVSELQRERSRLQQELARKQAIAAAETEASLLMARRETLLDRFAQQVDYHLRYTPEESLSQRDTGSRRSR